VQVLSSRPFSGRQADISWLRLFRKQNPLNTEVGALPTPSANHQPNGGPMDHGVAIIIHIVAHMLAALLIQLGRARRSQRR